MTTEAEEIQRIVSAAVRDLLDAYRFRRKRAGDRQGT